MNVLYIKLRSLLLLSRILVILKNIYFYTQCFECLHERNYRDKSRYGEDYKHFVLYYVLFYRFKTCFIPLGGELVYVTFDFYTFKTSAYPIMIQAKSVELYALRNNKQQCRYS